MLEEAACAARAGSPVRSLAPSPERAPVCGALRAMARPGDASSALATTIALADDATLAIWALDIYADGEDAYQAAAAHPLYARVPDEVEAPLMRSVATQPYRPIGVALMLELLGTPTLAPRAPPRGSLSATLPLTSSRASFTSTCQRNGSEAMKLGSVPIRVRPGFVVVAAILGSASRDPARGRHLGGGRVRLHPLARARARGGGAGARAIAEHPALRGGGLTSFAPGGKPLRGPGHVAISLAGPFAGFLGTLVYLAARGLAAQTASPLAALVVHDLLYCNFGWGILNLLQILPLDGGNVAKRILQAIRAATAERNARILSIVVAGAGAVWAGVHGSWFLALYALGFAGLNIQALRGPAARLPRKRRPDHPMTAAQRAGGARRNRADGRARAGVEDVEAPARAGDVQARVGHHEARCASACADGVGRRQARDERHIP